jgi:hypothetical protein
VDLRRLWWPASAGGFSSEDCALDRWKDLYVISLFQCVCWLKVGGVYVISLFHLFNGVSCHKKRKLSLQAAIQALTYALDMGHLVD